MSALVRLALLCRALLRLTVALARRAARLPGGPGGADSGRDVWSI